MGKVRLRHGDNEIELDGTDEFVKKQLEQFYARLGTTVPSSKAPIREQLLSSAPPHKARGYVPPPAEFYKANRKTTKTDGVTQILLFGKYLEEFRDKREFTPRELNAVAKEAKISKDIHPQFFANAVKQGLLRRQGRKYSLTLGAEDFLASSKLK